MKAIQDAHCETIVLLTCEDTTAAKQLETQLQQAEAEICPCFQTEEIVHQEAGDVEANGPIA